MTTDPSALRVLAHGNHAEGYKGVVSIREAAQTTAFACGHLHPTTVAARECIRRRIVQALTELAK